MPKQLSLSEIKTSVDTDMLSSAYKKLVKANVKFPDVNRGHKILVIEARLAQLQGEAKPVS